MTTARATTARRRALRGALPSLISMLAILAAGCTNAGGPEATGSTLSTLAPSNPTSTTLAATTTASSSTTTTAPTTTGPPATGPRNPGADLAPCTTAMPATLIEDRLFTVGGTSSPQPPPGWTPPPRDGFDWDRDGQPDELIIGQPPGTVTLRWAGASLTVTNLVTEFDQPLTNSDGTYKALPPYLADSVVPASVADVTGDGWLDLMVINYGTVSILAGAGDQTPTGTVPFATIGTETLGWTNPPIVADVPPSASGEPSGRVLEMPTPHSSVSPYGDISDDGIDDIVSAGKRERTLGPLVYYAGIPCRTRP